MRLVEELNTFFVVDVSFLDGPERKDLRKKFVSLGLPAFAVILRNLLSFPIDRIFEAVDEALRGLLRIILCEGVEVILELLVGALDVVALVGA